MSDTYIVGIDMIPFGRYPDQSVAQLGARAGLSPAHLQRVFTRVVGLSPRRFADACRLDRLKSKLKGGDTVTTAMTASGYGSSSRLYERAADRLSQQGVAINHSTLDLHRHRVLRDRLKRRGRSDARTNPLREATKIGEQRSVIGHARRDTRVPRAVQICLI